MPSKHHDGDPSGEVLKQQRALQAACRIQKQNVTPKKKTAGDAQQAITPGFETFKIKDRGPTKAVALLQSCRQQLRQSPAEGPAAWL